MRLVRPKSLKKLRASIKERTRRNNGNSMEVIVADINRTMKGWFAYFKHAKADEMEKVDGWIRMRMRSILRKRHGRKKCVRGQDHHRWRNHYFTKLGLFCLLEAREFESTCLRYGANH